MHIRCVQYSWLKYQGSAHWSPTSSVPHLIGPLLIGPPQHYLNSLVSHLIGPQFHWSPISLVPLFNSHPIFGPSQGSPISLVPHPNGPPSQWFPFSLVSYFIGPPLGTHPSPIPLVPHLIAAPTTTPHPHPHRIVGPPSHWSPIWHPCITHSIGFPHPIGPHVSLVSHLIGAQT